MIFDLVIWPIYYLSNMYLNECLPCGQAELNQASQDSVFEVWWSAESLGLGPNLSE